MARRPGPWTPLRGRLRDCLAGGPLSIRQCMGATGGTYDGCRTALNLMAKRGEVEARRVRLSARMGGVLYGLPGADFPAGDDDPPPPPPPKGDAFSMDGLRAVWVERIKDWNQPESVREEVMGYLVRVWEKA